MPHKIVPMGKAERIVRIMEFLLQNPNPADISLLVHELYGNNNSAHRRAVQRDMAQIRQFSRLLWTKEEANRRNTFLIA